MAVRRYSDFQGSQFTSADLKDLDIQQPSIRFGKLFSKSTSKQTSSAAIHNSLASNSRLCRSCPKCQQTTVGGFVSCQYCGHALAPITNIKPPISAKRLHRQRWLLACAAFGLVVLGLYLGQ